jgi:hypothetical protein
VKGSSAGLGQLELQPGAELRLGAGELEPVDHRAGVERGAPHQDRHHATWPAAGDRLARPPLELRHGGRLGDVEHVEEVVRHPPPLLGGQLGGADVHASVELHRVGVDHLAAERLGESEGEIGLADGGGTDERDDRDVVRARAGHGDMVPEPDQTGHHPLSGY